MTFARSHRTVASVLLAFAVSLSACSGSTQPQAKSVLASPTTIAGQFDIESVELSHIDGPAGLGPARTSTLPATTLPPATTLTPSTAVSPTLALTPSSSAVRTTPAVASTLATANTVAPRTNPLPAVRAEAPQATKPIRPTTRAKVVAPQITQTVPVVDPIVEPVVEPSVELVPSSTRVTSVKAKTAVAGSKCTAALVGTRRQTKKGQTVVCVRTKKKAYVWSVVSASAKPAPGVTPGFDGKFITLGVIGTTTNPTWTNISKAISAGFDARVAAINRRGGIGGKYQVKVLFRDANYDPGQTLVELNATRSQVVGYGSILGTPATEIAVPFLRDNQMLASPASQEGRWAKEANLLPVFNSYQIQAINGLGYFIEQSPGSIVCSVSVATTFGDAGNEGFNFAATDLGARIGTTVSIAPTDLNPAPVLAQLARSGCQGVLATVTPQQLAALVVGAARSNLAFRWISLGAGFSDRVITAQTSKIFEQTCWVIGDGPVWGDPATAALSADLLASDNRYWVENPDVGLTFGYTQARVWEAMLEAAVAAGDLSHAGLLAVSRSIGQIDTGALGSPINYSQPQRLSAPRAAIYAVDGSYKNSIRMLINNYSAPVASRFRLR
jgi:ABC-type branched-subunit amino acid transport system substrate-binding protein